MEDDSLGMRKEHFDCSCYSPEHLITFTLYRSQLKKWATDKNSFVKHWDKPEIYSEIFLDSSWRPWYKRVWIGIKYIFGYKCKYGHFDCAIFRPEDSGRFLDLAQEFHKEVRQYQENHKK